MNRLHLILICAFVITGCSDPESARIKIYKTGEIKSLNRATTLEFNIDSDGRTVSYHPSPGVTREISSDSNETLLLLINHHIEQLTQTNRNVECLVLKLTGDETAEAISLISPAIQSSANESKLEFFVGFDIDPK